MDTRVYNRRSHRDLPRDVECVASVLFGSLAGECYGVIHRHHVDPGDDTSPTIPACARHHRKLHAAIRALLGKPQWKRCPHKPGVHRYPGAREACERALNRDLIAA
ncbi:MAG: hypothetical protein H0U46_07905 [Actinobacteria bacterium]|nr:hypothetical protein [Actinomycetota bacterium]